MSSQLVLLVTKGVFTLPDTDTDTDTDKQECIPVACCSGRQLGCLTGGGSCLPRGAVCPEGSVWPGGVSYPVHAGIHTPVWTPGGVSAPVHAGV